MWIMKFGPNLIGKNLRLLIYAYLNIEYMLASTINEVMPRIICYKLYSTFSQYPSVFPKHDLQKGGPGMLGIWHFIAGSRSGFWYWLQILLILYDLLTGFIE